MSITRIAFYGMLVVACIELYELLRYRDATAGSMLMLALSLGAAVWLHVDELRNPSSE